MSDLNPVDFVNKVSKLSNENGDAIVNPDSKEKYTNPVPYIRSLKAVQDKLALVMEECDKKQEICENSIKEREKDHYKNVMTYGKITQNIEPQFNTLLSDVENFNSTKIDPLGEKLKKANTLKENSTNIIFLMKCYNNFYVKNEPPTELISDKQHTDSINTATVLSQLLKLASKLESDNELPKAKTAYEAIFKFATSFENDQLKSFNTYYHSKNFVRLQSIVKTLFAYNNGVNIVDYFVDSHQIFIQLQDKGDVSKDVSGSYWKELANPLVSSYSLDPASSELLEAVKETVLSEIDSITMIFQENSKQALSSLLFKLSEKIFRPRLISLLEKTNGPNKLCHLRILHTFSNGIIQIIFSKLRTVLLDKDIDLTVEFEKIYNSIFSEYLNENSYFQLEKENLESLINSLISPFENANKNCLKDRKLTNKIQSFKENHNENEFDEEPETVQNEQNPYEDEPSVSQSDDQPKESHNHFNLYLPDTRIFRDKMKRTGKYISNNQKVKKISNFIKVNEKYSLFDRYKPLYNPEIFPEAHKNQSILSLQITQNIYKLTLETLTRSIELVPSQINHYTVELFKLMLYKVGPSYIALGLESIYDSYIESQSKKSVFNRGIGNELDLSFLSQFYTIFTQLYLLSVVVKKSFYPLVSDESDIDIITNSFNTFLENVETGVNIIFNDLAYIIKDRINTILSKQPITDYAIVNDTEESQTSKILAQFFEIVLRNVLHELDFDPLLKMKFVSQISSYLLTSLILHLSHMKFTMNGFTTLTHDVVQYISIFNAIETDEFTKVDITEAENESKTNYKWEKEQFEKIESTFKILNELPGLYTCQPDSLNDFCSKGKLSELKKNVIKDYVSNREDFQEWFLKMV